MTTQFEREAFKVGLRKLLNPRGHFCICDFDSLAQLAGVPVSRVERESLRLLHCVNYGDMTREMKEALVAKLAEIFKRTDDPIGAAADALAGIAHRAEMGVSQAEILRLVNP